MRQHSLRNAIAALIIVVAAAWLAAACGGGRAEEVEVELPPAPPDPPGPVGAIVEVRPDDLPAGFAATENNLYNDIPGLLRDSEDATFARLGTIANEADRAAGQGFFNNATGEFIFIVTILLDDADLAEGAIDYMRAQPAESIIEFISPDELIFETEQRPAPMLADASVLYFLRYGVEQDGRRTRDVATDLLVLAKGASLVFIQHSVNRATGRDPVGDDFDLAALGRVISERIAQELAAQSPSPS